MHEAVADLASRARALARRPGAAMLATLTDGVPDASLVTPCCLPDMGVALLLSRLSRHTRALLAEPACALLFHGDPVAEPMAADSGPANPQTIPRLSLRGHAVPDDTASLRRRYLAVHPYAEAYAGFTDFSLFRFTPVAAHLVAGFGLARTLSPASLLGAPPVADYLAHEPDALAEAARHGALIDRLAGQALGQPVAGARLVAIDPDGADLIAGSLRARLTWLAPLTDPAGLGAALSRLADQPCAHAP